MSVNSKQWFGLPLNLIWGYIAIAVFMTGDGFELAFLSHYIKELGFTPARLLSPLPSTASPPPCRRGSPAWSPRSSPRRKPC